MSEFRQYNSISRSDNDEFIARVKNEINVNDYLWVAREKIHGANFSVIITCDDVRFARRTDVLDPSESFYGYKAVMDRYKTNFKMIQHVLKFTNDKQLQIFGELAGPGIHNGVSVFYSDEKDFYVFDAVATSNDGEELWASDDRVVQICDIFGFKIAPAIFIGTFNDGMNFDNKFTSLVSKIDYDDRFKVHETSFDETNIAEGFVLKPCLPLFLSNGSRVIIKSKPPEWGEKAGKAKVDVKDLTENDSNILSNLLAYVTDNRINNVVSKIGEIVPNQIGKVTGLTATDVIQDASYDGITLDAAENKKLITKELNSTISRKIRALFFPKL